MNTKVTISVIIPVYNCQQYLRQCIDSVLGQTLQDIEIFCIDDGSTDESLDVLQEYEETYSSVHVFQQPNSGAGAARNLGLQHAKGEYIAFLDADDYYLDADALQKMYCMCKQNNVKVCGSFGKVLEENIIKDADFFNMKDLEVSKIYRYRDFQFDYGYYTFIFERNMLIDNSIIFPLHRRYQDPPFLVKAMYCAKEFVMADTSLYCYRAPYSAVRYNQEKVIDLLKGIRDNLQFAMDNQLDILFTKTLQRLEYESAYIILANISKRLSNKNCEMMSLLLQLNDIAREYYKDKHYLLHTLQLLMMKAAGYTENYERIILEQLSREKKIAIYGAGKYAKQFLCFLQKENILDKVEYVIVSKPDGMQREMQGIPIIDVESFGAVNGHLKIFVAVGAMHHQSIEQTLQKNGCENYELLDDAFLGSF